jgi:hypothetical protein
MFGLTKRQFLKKSKECLKETGLQILLIRELMDKEAKKSTNIHESHRKLDNIRRDIENTFSWYENLNPPSECVSLQREIANALIIFHEAVVAYSESLIAAENGRDEESRNKLKESQDELEKFRKIFLPLSKEVDLYLRKK